MDQPLKLSRHPEAFFSTLGGEVVILSGTQQAYFSMKDSAKWVWEQLEQPKSKEELISTALEAFEGEASEIQIDLHDFIEELLKKDILSAEADSL